MVWIKVIDEFLQKNNWRSFKPNVFPFLMQVKMSFSLLMIGTPPLSHAT
jgi:hypothetical protein